MNYEAHYAVYKYYTTCSQTLIIYIIPLGQDMNFHIHNKTHVIEVNNTSWYSAEENIWTQEGGSDGRLEKTAP
jgi:hypothetical protein